MGNCPRFRVAPTKAHCLLFRRHAVDSVASSYKTEEQGAAKTYASVDITVLTFARSFTYSAIRFSRVLRCPWRAVFIQRINGSVILGHVSQIGKFSILSLRFRQRNMESGEFYIWNAANNKLEKRNNWQRNVETLWTGGQGPTSGSCAIE